MKPSHVMTRRGICDLLNSNLCKGIIAASLLVTLICASCSRNDDSENTLKLTAAEVAVLLGIDDNDDIQIGEIESDKSGVRVESIAYQMPSGKEIKFNELVVEICSPKKLDYRIENLKIAQLDAYDLQASRKVKVRSISLKRPGRGSIYTVEKVVSRLYQEGALNSQEIEFDQLDIGQINYSSYSNDDTLPKVSVTDFSISAVGKNNIGSLSIAKLLVGESAAIDKLETTNVDRRWADFLIVSLINSFGNENSSNSIREPDLGKNVLPFDSFKVKRILLLDSGRESNAAETQTAKTNNDIFLDDLVLHVRRNEKQELRGIDANLHLQVPIAGDPLFEGMRDIDPEAFQDYFTLDVGFEMDFDPVTFNEEYKSVRINIPKLLKFEASMTGKNMATAFAKLLIRPDIESELEKTTITRIKARLDDDGLFAHLASEKNPDRERFRDGIMSLKGQEPYETNEQILLNFLSNPGGFESEVFSTEPAPAGEMMIALIGNDNDDEWKSKITSRITLYSKN